MIRDRDQPLKAKDLFKLVYFTFKEDLVVAIILLSFAAALKLYFSYLILNLFQAVHQQNFTQAYIYCAVLTLIWYFAQLTNQSYGFSSTLTAPKIKATIYMFLYCKVSTLTSSVLRSRFMGTITNLIANDLSTLDERAPEIGFLVPFFITTVGTTVIVVLQVGWSGILAILLILLIVPATHCIAKANKRSIESLTKLKDARIKLTT